MLSVLAICIGACLGALARWGLGLWLNPGAVIPFGTLAANLIGGYLVGVCVAVFQRCSGVRKACNTWAHAVKFPIRFRRIRYHPYAIGDLE